MKSKNSLFFEKLKNSFKKIINNKLRLAKILLILIILIAALFIRLENSKKNDVKVEIESNNTTVTEEMYVDISGEVKNPGVYKVESQTRLFEVISKAGGLTESADANQINQADYVEDGEKIVIPSIIEENNAEQNNQETYDIYTGLVNINTASKEQLMTVSGIGEVTAEKIIEYRKNKRFKKKEDIMNIKGIGNAKYEKLKDEITT